MSENDAYFMNGEWHANVPKRLAEDLGDAVASTSRGGEKVTSLASDPKPPEPEGYCVCEQTKVWPDCPVHGPAERARRLAEKSEASRTTETVAPSGLGSSSMSPTPEPPNPPWHRVGPAHEYEIRAAEQAAYERGVRAERERWHEMKLPKQIRAERDAEIRAWLEREIDGITRLGDDYDQGTRYGLERALAWIGDVTDV